MKIFYPAALLTAAVLFSGCASTSQVQEMIDASHRDYLNRADSQEASIEVLKKSSMTALEKCQKNAEMLTKQQVALTDAQNRLKVVQGYAEASKVMSAANTVKVADLEDAMITNQERVDETTARLEEIDKLYEQVLIAHYQVIADSANEAIASLRENGSIGNTNAPVKIDEPIEIVAPDTEAVPTNAPPAE